MIFRDRAEAGRLLADKLAPIIDKDALVLAVPRGGVIVAAEIVRKLNFSLDLIIPRKIGAPHDPEVAIGAVTQDGTPLLNQSLIKLLKISQQELEDRISHVVDEIRRRLALYGAGQNIEKSDGRQLIVVDDGVATGYTMQAALRSVRRYGPKELILAIPVAPRDTLELLKAEADRVVCLVSPEDFFAVGQFYENFEQTDDAEVIKIMRLLKGINKKNQ